MCVLVCPSRVVFCTSWLGVLCGGVWLGLGWCRAAPLLAGALGRVCVCVRAPLVPRLSWLGFAVWACVLGSGFSCAPPFLVGLLGCVCGRACAPLAPALPGGPPVARGCAGVAVFCFLFFFGRGACRVLALWCRSLAVLVLGPVVSVPPSPSLPGCVVFFFPSQRGVCPRVLGVPFPRGPLLPAWCCRFWLVGPPVPLWGVLSSVPSGWGVWSPLAVLVGGLVALGRSRAPPPCFFFFSGGLCLFLPLPSLGWRPHWSAFSVVFRVAVGCCILPGRAPAPWVGWVMYTLGSAPLPAGLGSSSAGWAAAPGSFVWPWVRGAGVFRVLSPPRSRF